MSTSHEISHDLYRWLVQLQVLPNNQKYKSSGNFQLESRVAEQLQSGFLVAKVLSTLASETGTSINQPLMASIKNSNTPAARVYNWNILHDGFIKMGINLPKQKQKEITSGNFESLVRFLIDVHHKGAPKKIDKQKSQAEMSNIQALDLSKLKKYENLAESQSVLQFILVLIVKNLGLTSKQAVATLSDSAKYLAHMFVKGIKGSFDEIQSFLSEMTERMSAIMYLVEKDPQKNIQLLLQILKPALISRNADVAKLSTATMKALNYQSLKYNTKNIVYQVLCKENEGFDFIYMGLKRHPQLNSQIFDFLFPLIEHSVHDFLSVQLKKTINNEQEYTRTLLIILEPLLHNPESKKILSETKLIKNWQREYQSILSSKVKGKDLAMTTEETKILKTELMCILWVGYYEQRQQNQNEQLLIKITEQLKKNTRSDIHTVKIPALQRIFDLLDFLATKKNKLAALLYKKVIFLFVENHHQNQTRQIILQNLITVLKKFPTIPLEFLLEPLLKQLNTKEGTSYILNIYDFQFVIEMCKHPKMEEFYAVELLEYFTRIYIKSVVYSSLSFRIIEAITARFCESEHIREYCLHSAEANLNHYSMLVMGKNMGNKALYARDRAQTKEDLIISNQKRSLIIELLKHYVQLEHRQLTSDICDLVVELFIHWYEQKNHYDKGLASVLMLIGDIEEIVTNYKQKQFNQEEESREQSNPSRSESSPSKIVPFISDFQSRETPIHREAGLGYKKNKNITPLNKYEFMLSRKVVKPDPKVIEDLERIKEKWRLEQSRARLSQKQAKKEKVPKLNSQQLLQRNLSLGYSKLPPNYAGDGKILFDYDSVKTRHLKDTLDLIDLDEEEEREKKSVDNIIQRYQRYIKNLFTKYAAKSVTQGSDKMVISFTEIMRMLKEKNLLGKIPKIAINQTITAINKKRKEKNILGGIEEEDFPTFIIYLTDLIMRQDTENKKDQPFGFKFEKVLLKMLESEKNVRELFDPKIQKLKEQIEFDEDLSIPDDYKKIKQVQVSLNYYVSLPENNLDPSYKDCYEIADQLIYEALGIHVISPMTEFKEKSTLARVYKVPKAKLIYSQSTDKKIDRLETEEQNGKPKTFSKDVFQSSRKKQSRHIIKRHESKSQRNIVNENLAKEEEQKLALKQKRREAHAKQLKEQIEKLRAEKERHMSEKREQEKKEQERKKKREDLRQQYLDDNKKKLKEAREKQNEKEKVANKKEEEKKEKRKAEVKAKQVELLQKEKKFIENKQEKMNEKKKKQEFQEKQKEKLVKSKSNQKAIAQIKSSVAEEKMKDLMIKNSLENGQLKVIADKYDRQFTELFQSYWIWEKEKMDLKGLAQLLKDFEVCHEYVSPKLIADTFKQVTKGQFVNLNGFKECITKLSFKSVAIQEKTKEEGGNKKQENSGKLNVEEFRMMIKLLKMDHPNYKQLVFKTKSQSLG